MRSASSCVFTTLQSCHATGREIGLYLSVHFIVIFLVSPTCSHIPPFAGSPFPQRKGDTFCVISANCNDENCKSYCNQYFPGTAASCDHKTTQGRIICCCVPWSWISEGWMFWHQFYSGCNIAIKSKMGAKTVAIHPLFVDLSHRLPLIIIIYIIDII